MENEEVMDMMGLAFGIRPESIQLKEIGEKEGYLSVLNKVTLTWPKNITQKLPSSVVVKKSTSSKLEAAFTEIAQIADAGLPPDLSIDKRDAKNCQSDGHATNGFMDTDKADGEAAGAGNDPGAFWKTLLHEGHNHECCVLEMMSEKVPSLKAPSKTDVPVPFAYYCEPNSPDQLDGFIVMEDLSKGTMLPDFGDGLSVDQLRCLFKAIATLHAHCFSYPNFVAHFETNTTPLMFFNDVNELWTQVKILRTNFGEMFHKISDTTLQKYLDLPWAKQFWVYNESRDFFPVLTHGDMWCNNIMVQKSGDGDNSAAGLVSIIDWQLSSISSPVLDLVVVLSMSVNSGMRRQYTDELLEMYHSTLVEQITATSSSKIPLSFKQVKSLYRDFEPYGVFWLLCQVPGMIETMGLTEDKKILLAQRIVDYIEDVEKIAVYHSG